MIPVVALSVDASAEDIRDIYNRHANCCINKPTNMPELTVDLRNALSFWIDVALIQRGTSKRPNKSATVAP
jgi:hypothetical protein